MNQFPKPSQFQMPLPPPSPFQPQLKVKQPQYIPLPSIIPVPPPITSPVKKIQEKNNNNQNLTFSKTDQIFQSIIPNLRLTEQTTQQQYNEMRNFPNKQHRTQYQSTYKSQSKVYKQKPLETAESKEEITKWIQQRNKRRPRANRGDLEMQKEEELSKLEQKMRKKVRILSGGVRRIQLRTKQMKELCKHITEGVKVKGNKDQGIQGQQKPDPPKKDIFNVDDFFATNEENQIYPQSPPPEFSQSQYKLTKDDKKLTAEGEAQIKKEISEIEKQLQENRPKHFFKGQQENKELMSQSQKKKLKNKLKQLNQQLRNSQVVDLDNEEYVKDMIKSLKIQRENVAKLMEESLNYKSNPSNFKYKTNTLYTSLVLDQIYKEKSYLLQAIRYIVKQNFFDSNFPDTNQEDNLEEISVTSEEESDLLDFNESEFEDS